MKILHVTRTFKPGSYGGIEEFIRSLANNLQAYGIQSDVFHLDTEAMYPRAYRQNGIDCYMVKSHGAPFSCDIGGFSALKYFENLTSAYDLVHFHYPWPFQDLLAIAMSAGKKYVVTYHSDIVRQRLLSVLYAPIRKAFFGRAELLIATSQNYVSTSKVLGSAGYADKVRVGTIGISDRAQKACTAEPSHRVADALKGESPFFLFIGVLRRYKGLLPLVKAANKLGSRVLIAGDGPLKNKVSAIISQHPSANVTMLGKVSGVDKHFLLRGCAALILPSTQRSEAMGIALIEAAMYGKPMVSCELGTGTSYINMHGETGFVVNPGDVGALADAMQKLESASLRRKMGRKARDRYEEKFTQRTFAEQYRSFYLEALGQEGRE